MVNASYNPPGNTFKSVGQVNNEIKSHSSVLFNERLHVSLYILETESVDIHVHPKLKPIMRVKAISHQIWKSLRTLVFNDPSCRTILKLETTTPGVYSPDVGFQKIDEMIEYLLEVPQASSIINLRQIIFELDQIEIIIRNILQFYKYFIRFDKTQKPDIDVATERYRAMADHRTVEELRGVMGKSAKMNLDDLDSPVDDSYFEELESD